MRQTYLGADVAKKLLARNIFSIEMQMYFLHIEREKVFITNKSKYHDENYSSGIVTMGNFISFYIFFSASLST